MNLVLGFNVIGSNGYGKSFNKTEKLLPEIAFALLYAVKNHLFPRLKLKQIDSKRQSLLA